STDRVRLEQILKNFVSNAVKFTETGSVSLKVSSKGQSIIFDIIDTGIGIPAHQQGVIFEAFRQADGTTNRKYGGTGLGLSISKELTKLLGGSIKVHSEVGSGSTFSLTLPLIAKTELKDTSPVVPQTEESITAPEEEE